jgi:hypothetical protein
LDWHPRSIDPLAHLPVSPGVSNRINKKCLVICSADTNYCWKGKKRKAKDKGREAKILAILQDNISGKAKPF